MEVWEKTDGRAELDLGPFGIGRLLDNK